jgi:hypothetical protein
MVHGPYSVTYPNHTPIFEWCVVRLDLRTKPNKACVQYPNATHAHNLSIVKASITNTIFFGGGVYVFI